MHSRIVQIEQIVFGIETRVNSLNNKIKEYISIPNRE